LGVKQDGSPVHDEDSDWELHKRSLNMDFPNLPYLIDRESSPEIMLTQSNVIMRYLARRFDFYGDNKSEQLIIDILQEEAYDFRNRIVETAYTLGDDFPAAFADFTATHLPRYLDGFEGYLRKQENSTAFVGNRTSLVDFIIYELIWQTSIMVPGSITQYSRPLLHNFIEAFKKHPTISNYMASEYYIYRPINSVWASFT